MPATFHALHTNILSPSYHRMREKPLRSKQRPARALVKRKTDSVLMLLCLFLEDNTMMSIRICLIVIVE